MKYPSKYRIAGCAIAALAATELSLRFAFGLGNPALLQADSDAGYRFQPNQKIFRLGKNLQYNQYSQRSEPISLDKPQDTLRILMVGDSVLNGGNPTDQHQTITELFEANLSTSGQPVEVLNASAGSWGIGNQLGYLRKFGTFNADAVILQIGTHDLTQPTSSSDVVGKKPTYPNQKPPLAISETVTRYALPRLLRPFISKTSSGEVLPQQLNQQFQHNMENLEVIIKLVREEKVPVFVLFTPDRKNLVPTPEVPKYKPQFLQLLNTLKVPVIDTHTAWSSIASETVETYFRDGVHLSVLGNQAAAALLFQQLCLEQKLPVCSTR